MTFLATPLGFTPAEFKKHVSGLKWAKGWRPQFVTLHNTGAPTLKQWAQLGGLQRVCNLNHYYKTEQGWHSGPHLFIAPDLIWVACDLEHDGVHASCFNQVSIGIEMVGDYSVEAFDAGDGAKVRDNAVAAVATINRALNLAPQTLRFHKECLRDHHACPGKNVDKPDFVRRVTQSLGASTPLPLH